MSDDQRKNSAEERGNRAEAEAPMYRSLSAMLFQGAEAFGEATGGAGALALGVSKLKETFGSSSDQSGVQQPPPNDQPADQKPD
jgi:hypothetical protein